MPIYSFKCTDCGGIETIQMTMMEAEQGLCPDWCPECVDYRVMVRNYSGAAPGVVFKGSGWYSKDNG